MNTENINTNSLQTAATPAQTPPPGNNNMFIYLLIGITVIVLLGLSGFIVINFTTQKENQSSKQNRVYVTSAPTIPQLTPTPGLEEEISNLTIEDPSAEFQDLEKNLNSL